MLLLLLLLLLLLVCMKIYQMAKEPDGSIMNPEDGGSMYLHNIRSHYQTPPCNHGMKFYFITVSLFC